MDVLILGAGKSGRAAETLLARRGIDSRVLDGEVPFPDGTWAYAVASPAIPLTHPWIKACETRNIPIVSELELGASFWKGKALAVTGSKGKSSVVKLVADTLNLAGHPAVPCGNYGTPLCEVVNTRPDAEWAVVEVSSFQMEHTHNFHPVAAAVLNLQADHLDRHGDMFTYMNLKLDLLRGLDHGLALLPVGFPVTDGLPAHGSRLEFFGPATPAEAAGSYFDNSVLGPNAAAACALLRAAGLSSAEIRAGFAAFVPLHHRMEKIAEKDGIVYIDDSKATSLAALAAGVVMAGRPVRLIAGGLPKGDAPESVKGVLSDHVKKVYLIGRSAQQFFEAWRETVPSEVCGTLDRAVDAARREARPGEAVLLSPGTASFDQFKSYAARGDAFAALVKG